MSFFEKENKLREVGKILDIDNDQFSNKIYFIWYEIDNKTRILTNSLSLNDAGAKAKLEEFEKIVEQKKIPECKYGIGSSNILLSDIKKKLAIEKTGAYKLNNHILSFAKAKLKEDKILWSKLNIPNFSIIDTETTGTYNYDQVIEIAAIKVIKNEIVDEFREFIVPTVRINPEAEKVHGINMNFLLKNGKDAKEVFMAYDKWNEKLPVVGHNVPFDVRKIQYHSTKVGYPIILDVLFDTLQIIRKFYDMPDYKLENTINRFNLRDGLTSHNALHDVKATYRLAMVCKETYKQKIKPPLYLI
jgi:DNA polymerase III epsilon subunit-like protein